MESSDREIDEAVVVYNIAKGFGINYSDGTFKKINRFNSLLDY